MRSAIFAFSNSCFYYFISSDIPKTQYKSRKKIKYLNNNIMQILHPNRLHLTSYIRHERTLLFLKRWCGVNSIHGFDQGYFDVGLFAFEALVFFFGFVEFHRFVKEDEVSAG